MTKAELIKNVAKATKVSRKETAAVIDTFVAGIQKEVSKGKSVNLKGFGQFYTIERAARKGRNPSTGKAMEIPSTLLTKFKAGRSFKAIVKGKAVVAEKAEAKAEAKVEKKSK